MKPIKFIRKWWKSNQKIIGFILPVFFLWQILIAGIIGFGGKFATSSYRYVYVEHEKIVNPPILWSRANFDGIHYLDIARKGYGIYQQAFFPLYPRLIEKLAPVFGGRDLLAGWDISLVSLFLGLVLLVKLVKLDYEEKIAQRTAIFLLVFPTAFFFSIVYTESLFLFLILASFYFARTRKWWLAGVFGALASATGLAGVFLLPALLVEWWEQYQIKNAKPKIAQLIPIFLIPLGLLYYMRFLSIKFGDPLMFLHAQKIILLYQVFWRYFKMLWLVEKQSLTYFVVVLEFVSAVGFLALLWLAYRKRLRLSYLVFAVLSYLTPTLTGALSSMPRYVLTLFPCFITLSLIESRVIRYALLIVSFLLLVACTVLFTRGYWIA